MVRTLPFQGRNARSSPAGAAMASSSKRYRIAPFQGADPGSIPGEAALSPSSNGLGFLILSQEMPVRIRQEMLCQWQIW